LKSGASFRELISGRRRGPIASLERVLLSAAELPYTAAVGWRNRNYNSGRWPAARVGVPVVSVGNLTLGGTGKTPAVEWIARWYRNRGVRVVLVSRGYGRKHGSSNDEALELAQKLPDVPHLQDPDRVRAARQAIAKHGAELVLLDDAFQHRRIARDLDIVLVDALEPYGFEHVFPRGTLREPLSSLARADVVMLTRADLVSADQRDAIHERAGSMGPKATWVEATHEPQHLVDHEGQEVPLSWLAGRRIAAFCGIGNPSSFRRALERLDANVIAFREFPDHFAYDEGDLVELQKWCQPLAAEAFVCTQKDLVKIHQRQLDSRPLWALAIRLEITSGQSALESALAAALANSTGGQNR